MSKKEIGCGGRYSYLAFMPCRFCTASNDEECKKILKRAGYQGKHEEYWIYPTKRWQNK